MKQVVLTILCIFTVSAQGTTPMDVHCIQPYAGNPSYWQYQRRPVMLLGGSDDDNLFQITRLIKHLDRMQHVGANYIRNTMSSRDDGNEQPFMRLDSGKYDLDRWNPAYWQRFKAMLAATHERGIVVQIEVWAFHDFYRFWEHNPWNPQNNITYTEDTTRLKGETYGSCWDSRHDFFYSVPKLHNDKILLSYQQRFVDKLLSHALKYDHVLYCMTNEIFTQYSPEWGWYWAGYIRAKARDAGVAVHLAEMFQNHDLDHEQHRASFEHPEIYDFIDISQNSRQLDQKHWDRLQWVRQYISHRPRPVNHTKTYGGDLIKWTDGDDHGIERFWRNILGGAASVRFHRPTAGIGLNDRAQAHIRSARMLLDEFDIFRATPDVKSERLADRDPDEAYLTFIPGEASILYFPDGGDVRLNIKNEHTPCTVRWLDIEKSSWHKATPVAGDPWIGLVSPGSGNWAVIIKPVPNSDATSCNKN